MTEWISFLWELVQMTGLVFLWTAMVSIFGMFAKAYIEEVF